MGKLGDVLAGLVGLVGVGLGCLIQLGLAVLGLAVVLALIGKACG